MRPLSRLLSRKKAPKHQRVNPPISALPRAPGQAPNTLPRAPHPNAAPPVPRPSAPQTTQRPAAPLSASRDMPAPRAMPAQKLDGLIDTADPRDSAHLALRTVKKQGPGFGNVKPLGAIDPKQTQRLFGQAAPEKLPKRDPAPSRARYRMQRLWLTPMVHRMLRVGLPAVALGALALFFLSDEALRENIAAKLAETRESFQARPEFRVELFKINGVDESVGQKVRAAAGLTLPMTSFELELEDVRKRIEALDAVKSASLFLRTGGILDAEIEPRVPVVLLRKRGGLELLDQSGILAGTISKRGLRPDLPVLAGEGAQQEIDQALTILAKAAPIKERLRGLQRVGERRWDLVLDRDMVIKLPTKEPVRAVERAVALHLAQNLLDRDIISLDLRDGARPFVQMTGDAMHRLKLLKHLPVEETSSQ